MGERLTRAVAAVALSVTLRFPAVVPRHIPRHRRRTAPGHTSDGAWVPASPGRRVALRRAQRAVGGAA